MDRRKFFTTGLGGVLGSCALGSAAIAAEKTVLIRTFFFPKEHTLKQALEDSGRYIDYARLRSLDNRFLNSGALQEISFRHGAGRTSVTRKFASNEKLEEWKDLFAKECIRKTNQTQDLPLRFEVTEESLV